MAVPARGPIPLRGSAGLAVGLYQGVSGSRATSAWFSGDVRLEFDPAPLATIFAGIGIDLVPGAYGPVQDPGVGPAPGWFGALTAMLGVRLHFGSAAPR
jgi:hypothetical protein